MLLGNVKETRDQQVPMSHVGFPLPLAQVIQTYGTKRLKRPAYDEDSDDETVSDPEGSANRHQSMAGDDDGDDDSLSEVSPLHPQHKAGQASTTAADKEEGPAKPKERIDNYFTRGSTNAGGSGSSKRSKPINEIDSDEDDSDLYTKIGPPISRSATNAAKGDGERIVRPAIPSPNRRFREEPWWVESLPPLNLPPTEPQDDVIMLWGSGSGGAALHRYGKSRKRPYVLVGNNHPMYGPEDAVEAVVESMVQMETGEMRPLGDSNSNQSEQHRTTPPRGAAKSPTSTESKVRAIVSSYLLKTPCDGSHGRSLLGYVRGSPWQVVSRRP